MWLMPLYNGKPIIRRCKKGPAPRWRNPRIPAKTMVHVNTHKIKENQKQKLQQPVITVKKRKVEAVRSWGFPKWRNCRGGVGFRPAKLFKTRCDPSLISLSTLDAATVATLGNSESAGKSQNVNLYGHEVEILGGCRVVYRPNASKCGAKVWIETLNEVKVICWDCEKLSQSGECSAVLGSRLRRATAVRAASWGFPKWRNWRGGVG